MERVLSTVVGFVVALGTSGTIFALTLA